MTVSPARESGFTLLETVVALAILAMALMAIFDINSGAVANHVFTKRLTVGTLLARSKMVDLEQELFDKGFSVDDDEQSGDFSDEGWPSYKWSAKILAPQTKDVPTDRVLSALFNIPAGGGEGGLGALIGGGAGAGANQGAAGMAAGPLAGFAQTQMQQMIDQIGQSVREVQLTVSWMNGDREDTLDLVTHVVSLGPGSDRNSSAATPAPVPPPGKTTP